MKKINNILIFVFFLFFSYQNALGFFGFEKVNEGLIGKESPDVGLAMIDFITYILGFVGLIGIIWIIYSGFQILTAGGDDEKVKNGKKTMLFALLGVFVIWIAWALVSGIYFGLKINT